MFDRLGVGDVREALLDFRDPLVDLFGALFEPLDVLREGAVAVLRDLGLDPDAQIRTSYLGLLLEDAPDNAQK